MGTPVLLIAIVGLLHITSGSSSELQCKLRVGCEADGCNPLSGIFYDGKYDNDFPILCQPPSDDEEKMVTEDHEKLEELKKFIDENITQINEDIFNLTESKQHLSSEVNILKTDTKNLTAAQSALDSRLKKLEDANEDFKKEIDNFKVNQGYYDQKLSDLQLENDNLKKEIANLTLITLKHENRFGEIEENSDGIEEDIARLKERMDSVSQYGNGNPGCSQSLICRLHGNCC